MAFNGMKVIHSGLGNRLRYIMNPAKTEGGLLVAGVNTTPASALSDMMDTKHRYGKLDKRQGYHIIQSFKPPDGYQPGEITPDEALRFGMEFIEKYLDNRYEGVVAVHTDKAHVHVHILFNSVSFIDGRKFHAAKGEYLERIRSLCDEQCRAWGLSVMEGDPRVRKTTEDEARCAREGKPSCRDLIRADIDRAISEGMTWQHFVKALRRQGYDVKESRQNMSLKAPGMQRFIRLRSLGDGYQREDIQRKLNENLLHPERARTPDEVPFPADEALDRFIGTQAEYYNITQQMRRLIARQHMHYSPALRAEIRKLDQWQEDMDFQSRHSITTPDQLRDYQGQVQCLISEISDLRKPVYQERRTTIPRDPQRMKELDARLAEYKSCLAGLRRELRIAARIEDRLLTKVPVMLAMEQAHQAILASKPERSSRTER
jgi:hypothetical protein